MENSASTADRPAEQQASTAGGEAGQQAGESNNNAAATTAPEGEEGAELTEDPTEIFHESNEEVSVSIDITATHFKYVKPRSMFGKQTQFLEDRARVHCGLRANRERYFPMYQQMSVVSKQVDTMPDRRCIDTNTSRAEFRNFKLLHKEGGWPKEVNLRDPESIEKARRKFQKEDSFVDVIPNLTKEAEILVKHNNSLGLCEPLNKKLYVPKRDSKPYASVVSVYKCPTMMRRPVSKVYFCPNDPGRMVCAYCPYEFDPLFREHSCEAFFWEVENPTRPEGLVRAAAQIVDCRYHPFAPNLICGALFTGQVCTWDTRVGPNPQLISGFEVSHEDVCTNAIWTASEDEDTDDFFSSGLDGQIIWWDSRNLEERLDMTRADTDTQEQCPPISAMEFQNSLASKFLVGTQYGQILSFNRAETESSPLVATYKAHKGPITSINRNPLFPDYFVSCGGYDLRIFAEECKESGIMWTSPSDTLYSYGTWLKGRPCSLVSSRMDGCLEFWDLLILGSSSILTTKICEEALSTVCPTGDGELIAAGTANGEIRMVQMCPFLTKIDEDEKQALGASFAREARRENQLAQRFRGQTRKSFGDETDEEEGAQEDEDEGEEDVVMAGFETKAKMKPDPFKNPDILADKEFFDMLADEKKRQGINAFADKKAQAEELSQALVEGRMEGKKEAVDKAHKGSDSELGATQMLNVNEEALSKANAIAEGEKPAGGGEGEEEEEEEDDEGEDEEEAEGGEGEDKKGEDEDEGEELIKEDDGQRRSMDDAEPEPVAGEEGGSDQPAEE